MFCITHGEGGWQYADPPWMDWIVIVQGIGDKEGGRNETIREVGGNVVGVDEEEYVGTG